MTSSSSQYGDWTAAATLESLPPYLPTPRPSITRFVWSGEATAATTRPTTLTPRLTFHSSASPIAAGGSTAGVATAAPVSPSLPRNVPTSSLPPRNVTPLKRAVETTTASSLWQYPATVYYRRQSSETGPLIAHATDIPAYSAHYRAHTPPPSYHQYSSSVAPTSFTPENNAPIFGYRALSLPRSVTPPPVLDVSPSHTVSPTAPAYRVSLNDLSPFMILRIKALVELCSIPSNSGAEEQTISTKVAPPPPTIKSCLKVKKSPEQIEKDNQVFNEDMETRMSALLTQLLEASKCGTRRDALQVLWKANEEFASRYFTSSDSSNEAAKSSRLEFSPGATLICFDSGDKPRKIRDNHSKHYAQFLLQQRAPGVIAGGGVEEECPPPAPPPVSTQLTTPKSFPTKGYNVAPRSLTPPLSRLVSENV